LVIHFGNDTLPPLHKIVQKNLCLHNVVEKEKSKQVQPVTFDWTWIEYPTIGKNKYDNFKIQIIFHAKDITKKLVPLSTIPISFSLKLPELNPPAFEMKQTCNQIGTSSSSSMSNSHKHIGKHLECLTCEEKNNNLQGRIYLKAKVPNVDLFMLSLPRKGLGNIKRFPSGEET
jgi:hypothetical protein